MSDKPSASVYALAQKGSMGKPVLIVAKDEEEMLSKLKRFFQNNITQFKATYFYELELELESMGQGYQGAPDYSFEIVTPYQD